MDMVHTVAVSRAAAHTWVVVRSTDQANKDRARAAGGPRAFVNAIRVQQAASGEPHLLGFMILVVGRWCLKWPHTWMVRPGPGLTHPACLMGHGPDCAA